MLVDLEKKLGVADFIKILAEIQEVKSTGSA